MNKYHFHYQIHVPIFADSEEEARTKLQDVYPILGIDFELVDVESPVRYDEVSAAARDLSQATFAVETPCVK